MFGCVFSLGYPFQAGLKGTKKETALWSVPIFTHTYLIWAAKQTPGIDQFDGDFFGVSEAELRAMDPHQRLGGFVRCLGRGVRG